MNPQHKIQPFALGGPMVVGPEPYSRLAPSVRTMRHTSLLVYMTRYPASPNHAYYLLLGRSCLDSRPLGITWNCLSSHSLGERFHNRRPSSDTWDREAVHRPLAGTHQTEHGRPQTPLFYRSQAPRSR